MATIAAALIGAGATYYAGRQANKRSRSQRQMEDLMRRNAELTGGYGEEMLGYSREAMKPVYDWYTKLGTGDRDTLMQHFKPEIEAEGAAGRRAFQTSAELNPRSGIATERTSRIPIDNASAIARIISGGRAAGIAGLGELGSTWGSLGMRGLGQGSEGAGQFLDYGARRTRDSRESGAAAGDSAYAIFKLIQEAMANRNKTSSGAGTGTGVGGGGSFWGSGASGGY